MFIKVYNEKGEYVGVTTKVVPMYKGKINFMGIKVIDIEYVWSDEDNITYFHNGTQYYSYYKHLVVE